MSPPAVPVSVATRHVGCHLRFDVLVPTVLALMVAPAAGAGRCDERLAATIDGRPPGVAPHVLDADHGGRVHVVTAPVGLLVVDYSASVTPDAGSGPPVAPDAPIDVERLTYLRQSRYCPSDQLAGFAAAELGHLEAGADLMMQLTTWVGRRLAYEGGASGPLDTAIDTLLAGQGVCRDFAHLGVAMARALGVPARLAAVYAPGLSPMDFHAVVEAHVDGRWQIYDATRLAPRPSLVRVATGRDAADTAFATTVSGDVELVASEVFAVVDGDLPLDDHTAPVTLA